MSEYARLSTQNARRAGRAKLTGALACVIVTTCRLAHGQPVETIGRLPCGQLTPETLAAQPWNADGQPFGLPIAAWTSETFHALKSRAAACHSDKPPATVRSLIRHIEHLEGHTKPILDTLAQRENYLRGIKQGIENDLNEVLRLPAQQAVDKLEDVRRRLNSVRLPVSDRQEFVSKLEAQHVALQERLRTEQDRLTVERQQRERIQQSEAQVRAKLQGATEAHSSTRLKELIAEIRSMPPTAETARKLNELLSNNKFRLPELTFPDQNTYHQVISEKLAEASNNHAEAKCAPVVSKLNVPPELEGSVIPTPVGNFSLTQFLCAAAVGTGRVSIAANPRLEGVYVLKIKDLSLVFESGRYIAPADAFFPRSSPVQQGVKAISLQSATTPEGPIALDRGFIVNLHAQFTPQMAVFLAQ